jgi:anthranilate phosphoribosyltransferase
MLNAALDLLIRGESLSRVQSKSTLAELLDGDAPPERLAMLLTALQMKSETAAEIAGFVDCLRGRALCVDVGEIKPMDVCGTGGDRIGTFNVSTAVAFVAAGAGQYVAKHGNRSVSSSCGSFDVLEALGVPSQTDCEKIIESLRENHLAFLFAQDFHPVLKKIAPLRKNLGIPTTFNLIGPLLNPVNQVTRQVIGVASLKALSAIAEVLPILGYEEAMIVHSEDGMDEISLSARTYAAHFKDGKDRKTTLIELAPENFGLNRAPLESVRGGTASDNAKIILDILSGERSPKRDLVVMNSAAALLVGGAARDFQEGAERAIDSIDSGKALKTLSRLRREVR